MGLSVRVTGMQERDGFWREGTAEVCMKTWNSGEWWGFQSGQKRGLIDRTTTALWRGCHPRAQDANGKVVKKHGLRQ